MLSNGRRVLAVAAATFFVTSVAVAASSFTPQLDFPDGYVVHAGSIKLKVRAPSSEEVFIQIERRRVLKHGFLKSCTESRLGCEFTSLKPWKHHKDWWRYRAPRFRTRGWWSTTPGKYYWQAQSIVTSPPCSFEHSTCVFNSPVGSFRVR